MIMIHSTRDMGLTCMLLPGRANSCLNLAPASTWYWCCCVSVCQVSELPARSVRCQVSGSTHTVLCWKTRQQLLHSTQCRASPPAGKLPVASSMALPAGCVAAHAVISNQQLRSKLPSTHCVRHVLGLSAR